MKKFGKLTNLLNKEFTTIKTNQIYNESINKRKLKILDKFTTYLEVLDCFVNHWKN